MKIWLNVTIVTIQQMKITYLCTHMKFTIILSFFSLTFMACGNSSAQDSSQNQAAVQQLQQSNLITILEQDSVILIDVRTPGEVNQGFIVGADSFIDYNSSEFKSKINQLDTNYTYVMYCRSGGRSGKASQYMVENGFNRVYNLAGGILQYKGELKKP